MGAGYVLYGITSFPGLGAQFMPLAVQTASHSPALPPFEHNGNTGSTIAIVSTVLLQVQNYKIAINYYLL